jgi:Tol biopolymer transport system component
MLAPMQIDRGSRLGPYEIVSRLGAGGMGEVWRATDTRLDRSVAIKMLPSELADNAQFKIRFEREAKTISQLNHPHICTLYDIGTEQGSSFIVMELVGGESLADVIARGPLAPNEVLKYGSQIAEALAAAHHAGVVHRDLKPANVMITKSGAKLLDFGLAKSNVIDISSDDATQQKPLTQEGTILGTFQYMAPEQLEGEEADARTDIFALGALLHEMATGKRAFSGKTKTSLIAAIVKEQPPPIAELQPLTPAALQHVVDRCLAKDREERWQSALDVAAELRWIAAAGSQAGIARPSAQTVVRRKSIIALAAIGWLLAVAGAVAAMTVWSRARSSERATKLELAQPLDESLNQPLAVSPDGRRVALIIPGAPPHLAVRDLDTGETRQLAGTESPIYPFWAPDGHALGFFVTGSLKVVDLMTGAVQRICDAADGRGGTWGRDGVIVFAPDFRSQLYKVAENGGVATPVTQPKGNSSHRNPMFLPDGKHFLYCAVPVSNSVAESSVRLGSVDGTVDQEVLPQASNLSYVDGTLLFARDRNLVAQPFDVKTMTLTGKPSSLAQNVDWYLGRWLATFSAGGETLIYRRAPEPRRQLLVLDSNGAVGQPVGGIATYALPAVSADGAKVIVNRGDTAAGGSDLWMLDLAGGSPVRLTFQAKGTMDDTALFSPDGSRLVLVSSDTDGVQRAWVQPFGGGSREMLRADSEQDFVRAGDWSPDGQWVLTTAQRTGRGYDVEMTRLDGRREAVPLLHNAANEASPRVSPTGRWLAYESDESGRIEVFVTDFPGAKSKWQVSTGGGSNPGWSADGKTLYYLANRKVVAGAVHEGNAFSSEPAKPVDVLGDGITGYAVARNTGRIVAVRELDAGEPPLTVVMNWRSLLAKQ